MGSTPQSGLRRRQTISGPKFLADFLKIRERPGSLREQVSLRNMVWSRRVRSLQIPFYKKALRF